MFVVSSMIAPVCVWFSFKIVTYSSKNMICISKYLIFIPLRFIFESHLVAFCIMRGNNELVFVFIFVCINRLLLANIANDQPKCFQWQEL